MGMLLRTSSCRAGAASPPCNDRIRRDGVRHRLGRGCQPRAGCGAAVLQHRNRSSAVRAASSAQPQPLQQRAAPGLARRNTAWRGAACTERAGSGAERGRAALLSAPIARSSVMLQGERQRRVTPPGSSHLDVPPPASPIPLVFFLFPSPPIAVLKSSQAKTCKNRKGNKDFFFLFFVFFSFAA